MAKREQFYADLPSELQEADELLRRFGRWAKDRSKPERCGSAEGNYKSPPNDDDRSPREMMMPPADVEAVRSALRGMQTVNRTVVMWLYVPDREPVQAKMRRCGVPPRIMRERHMDGVKEFWSYWMQQQGCKKSQPVDKHSIRSYCVST